MKKLILLLVLLSPSISVLAQDTLTEREDFYRGIAVGDKDKPVTGVSYIAGQDKRKNIPDEDARFKWTFVQFEWDKIDTNKLGYFEITPQDTFWCGISFYHPEKFTNDSLVNFTEGLYFSRLPGYGYLCYQISGFRSYTEMYNFVIANKELLFVKDNSGIYNVKIYLNVKKNSP